MKKIIVAVAALALMAGSAYAADWNFYGSARVSTFWYDVDRDGAPDPDTQFDEGLQGNARIGAKVKVSDELTGRFEYGASEDVSGNSGSRDANIRLLYGEWNFGAGKLLVGQDYVPMYLTGSNQVVDDDAALSGWGEIDGTRHAQIKLTFGDFQIAFVENNKNVYDNNVAGGVTDDVIMPMIQVQYALTLSNFVITMAGGYQTFDVETANIDDDVTSWGLGLDVAATFGAFTVTGQVNGGTNVGNIYNIHVNDADAVIGQGYADVSGTKVIDNDAIGGRIAVGYTFNQMFGVEVGYGYQQTEFDVSGSEEDEVQSYYIQFPITLAPGVIVVPEIGVVDYEDDSTGAGEDEITYFGAKWQINF